MEANRVILFYNSYSGNKTFINYLDDVIDAFQKKGMYILPCKITWDHEGMVNFLSSQDRSTIKKVIISGGDGSIDICLNALIEADYHAPLAIFPNGTANDLSHNFNIPNDIYGMISVALEDNYQPLDVGIINDKYFANEASMGFLIDVSQKTDQKLKNRIGMLAYYLKGLEELVKLKPFSVKINTEGREFTERIYFMLVMNGDTAGGFRKIAPDATVGDGKFDVVIFKECNPLDFVNLVVSVLKKEHINSPHVDFFKTSDIYIESEIPVGTDVDGEKGPELPLHIKVIPQRFMVSTPRAFR